MGARTSELVETEQLANVAQLAFRLNVRPSWIYTAVAAGRIPFVRVGKHIRFNTVKVLARLTEEQTAAGR